MTKPVEPTSDTYRLVVKRPSLLTLIILISYGSIGSALFTPAIPVLTRFFSISPATAQMTLMIYLVGYCLGQLIHSPIAKRFGRKMALYSGIGASIFGFILCALSFPFESYNLLVVGRLVSALGSSVGLSLTFMIICDYYYETHARKVTAYTMLAFAVIPGLAIAIGGALVEYLGWASCFYFLILYSLFALFLVYHLSETALDREYGATQLKKVLTAYRRDFRNRMLTRFSTMIGITTALIYLFAGTAPLIAIKGMGLSAGIFGLYNLIPAAGFFLGNFIAARLSSKVATGKVLATGIFLIGAGVVLFAFLILMGWRTPLTLFLPVFVIYFGIPLFYSNAAVLATFRAEDKPNASSIMSFFNIFGAVVGLIIIQLLPGPPTLTLPLIFVLFTALLFLLYRRNKKYIGQ
ncbi:MAG: MFS transporter [Chlamydiia bacterium]|nr:MFS transporter [Chlamydiia bacterium]